LLLAFSYPTIPKSTGTDAEEENAPFNGPCVEVCMARCFHCGGNLPYFAPGAPQLCPYCGRAQLPWKSLRRTYLWAWAVIASVLLLSGCCLFSVVRWMIFVDASAK
jgi:hypothetical protein